MSKKALLVGINYTKSARPLKGCHNDVHNVLNFLVGTLGYSQTNTKILLDDDKHPQPTKAAIVEGMKWLVSDAKPGDYLFFHYSGHGTQVRDTSDDETDGMDEALVPVDYEHAGVIVDDDMHQILVASLPEGVHLTVVMDCCHSGTGLDLPYSESATRDIKPPKEEREKEKAAKKAEKERKKAEKERLKQEKKAKKDKGQKEGKKEKKDKSDKKEKKDKSDKKEKKDKKKKPSHNEDGSSVKATVVLFSGCKDDQCSADTVVAGQATGALSHAWIETLKANPNISYIDLLYKVRERLKYQRSIIQTPQISYNRENFDLDQPFRA